MNRLLFLPLIILWITTAQAEVICNKTHHLTNLREGPSAKNYSTVDTLKNGHPVKFLRAVENPDGYEYYQVEFTHSSSGKNLVAFVYSENVGVTCSVLKTNSKKSEKSWVICNKKFHKTNLRKGPSSKNFGIAATLNNGNSIEILNRIKNSAGYVYYEVRFSPVSSDNYIDAFVYHEYVSNECDSNFLKSQEKAKDPGPSVAKVSPIAENDKYGDRVRIYTAVMLANEKCYLPNKFNVAGISLAMRLERQYFDVSLADSEVIIRDWEQKHIDRVYILRKLFPLDDEYEEFCEDAEEIVGNHKKLLSQFVIK